MNEVYWPSTGRPQIRDFSFYLVGAHRWIDLKRTRRYRLCTPGPYLPSLTITHEGDDYRLDLDVLPDPRRDVLLIRYKLDGPYRLVAILAPHLGSTGHQNHAWTDGGYAYARRGNVALCLMADAPLLHLSCGYVGFSDGWQDLNRHGTLTYAYSQADNGTVALSAEASSDSGILSLGFAETRERTLWREPGWRTSFGLVSMDFSYLVRLGLRDANDPRIQNTLRVVDDILPIETPSGPLYHRYNEDGYGEHANGAPFDGSGIGRAWPLLVGERGHLAMQAGHDSLPYLQTIWNCASAGGLLPEQVWDTAAIPSRELEPGRPSGSAMPLLWTHAEALCRRRRSPRHGLALAQ